MRFLPPFLAGALTATSAATFADNAPAPAAGTGQSAQPNP
jgi:hypothetical protein